MAIFHVNNVRIAGIYAAVPSKIEYNDSLKHLFKQDDSKKVFDSLGIKERRVVDGNVCTSDLCVEAAEELLDELKWGKDSISLLIFVSQTPDHLLPSTSCLIQKRLKLPESCISFDINLGCSGYVYGLSVISKMISSTHERALLLVGDTPSLFVSKSDPATAPVFGDAGTATCLEFNENNSMVFDFGTDGRGGDFLKIDGGGYRNKNNPTKEIFMDGKEVFSFALRNVPKSIKSVLNEKNWIIEDVDAFVLHQANSFLLKHIGKQLKISTDKLIIEMEKYGNTSAASIPLALSVYLSKNADINLDKVVMSGFGVGWSWGSAAVSMSKILKTKVLEI